jgi:hypothetical protein
MWPRGLTSSTSKPCTPSAKPSVPSQLNLKPFSRNIWTAKKRANRRAKAKKKKHLSLKKAKKLKLSLARKKLKLKAKKLILATKKVALLTSQMVMAKKAKQTELPGVEKPTIKELDAAIELYAEKRDAWVAARTEVQAAKAKLVELANTHGITIYRDDSVNPPLMLTLRAREALLKVTAVGAAAVDEADEDVEELDA